MRKAIYVTKDVYEQFEEALTPSQRFSSGELKKGVLNLILPLIWGTELNIVVKEKE